MMLLDAFSCAAIGADGYRAAGWEVVCLDNDQRALAHARAGGYETVHGDALALLEDAGFMAQFDAVHASPPCQLFSATRRLAIAQGKGTGKRAVDLLHPTIDLFDGLDTPWVIENVERSPLRGRAGVVRFCGSSFGLRVQRHRLFLSNVALVGPECDHSRFELDPISGKPRPWGVYYAKGDNIPSGGRTCLTLEDGMAAMGVTREVPWKYLCEAIPPAFTEAIGRQLLGAVASLA